MYFSYHSGQIKNQAASWSLKEWRWVSTLCALQCPLSVFQDQPAGHSRPSWLLLTALLPKFPPWLETKECFSVRPVVAWWERWSSRSSRLVWPALKQSFTAMKVQCAACHRAFLVNEQSRTSVSRRRWKTLLDRVYRLKWHFVFTVTLCGLGQRPAPPTSAAISLPSIPLWVQILQKTDSNTYKRAAQKQRAEEGRRESIAVSGPDTCWRLVAAVRPWRSACTKTPRRPVAAPDPPRAENVAWCGGQIPTPWIRSCWNMARKNRGRADGNKFKFPPLIPWWGTEKQMVWFL